MRSLYWIIVLVLFPALERGMPTAGQSVTFLFAPPHGATFVEITRTEKQVEMSGQPPQRQITEQRATYSIARTGQGYVVSVKPARAKDLVMSQQAEQVALDLLSRMELTFELDSSGRLRRVSGVQSGLRLVTQALGKEITQVMLTALGSSSLEDAAAAQWNNRGLLGVFAGTTLPIGQPQSVRAPVPLPIGGAAMGDVTIAVNGPVACGSKACHGIKINMSSKDEAIGGAVAGFLNTMTAGMLKAFGADTAMRAKVPQFVYQSPSLVVHTERLLEAQTGLPHSETILSTISITFGITGSAETASFRFVQKQTSRFEYPS